MSTTWMWGRRLKCQLLADAVRYFGFTDMRSWGVLLGNWQIGIFHFTKAPEPLSPPPEPPPLPENAWWRR